MNKLNIALKDLEAANEVIDELEQENSKLIKKLGSIYQHIQGLDKDALGLDPEVGFSYRDEMLDSIWSILQGYDDE